MTGPCALLALTLISTLCLPEATAYLLPNETECPSEALVDLTEDFEASGRKNGSITVNGVFYPEDAVRWIEGRALGCPCRTKACLPLCCAHGTCLPPLESNNGSPKFFPIYDPNTRKIAPGARVDDFWQFAWNPCHGTDRYALNPSSGEPESTDDAFEIWSNGSLYQPALGVLRGYADYCVDRLNNETLQVVLCFDEPSDGMVSPSLENVHAIFPVGMLVSVPFLIATFAVYMLIPELRNLPGLTLSAYVFSLIVAYVALATLQVIKQDSISDLSCYIYAYIVHFSFLASFFWLNVMCFDIWWTFGGFRSLHGSVKQRERKKFIMYSIYAWGCATILTAVCMVMDLVPGIPTHLIRPEFGVGSCWFNSRAARAIYFYGPMGVTVVCNICLFILTALKIIRHKKDTARQLKGSDSRRHDDNKQWFNLYLKLFIVMGINWSMEIISWLCEGTNLPKSVWYITDLTNTLQGVIIFIIFVWKDKIKRLLMKRFGCKGNFLSRNSTSRPTSSTSRATCVTTTAAQLQEKTNPYAESYRAKSAVTDESDCI